ncbi:hypothetical protein B5X24_HaOG210997 [Helicoverpa armigera]|nr:hypothetical protein B5X24_HaOG210997 [Helicoverpa armigera]
MRGELPQCTRCCFCLPLRYGLLAWGYFKMIADALLISLMIFHVISLVMIFSKNEISDVSMVKINLYIMSAILLIFVPDFLITIMFIVGGHKKEVRPIKVFYYYSIGIWIVTILFTILVGSVRIVRWASRGMTIISLESFLITFSAFFVVLVVQSYLLLLLRSEIIKLSNNCGFEFVNDAAEAACTMKCAEEVAIGEMDPEDILNGKGFC